MPCFQVAVSSGYPFNGRRWIDVVFGMGVGPTLAKGTARFSSFLVSLSQAGNEGMMASLFVKFIPQTSGGWGREGREREPKQTLIKALYRVYLGSLPPQPP